MDYPSYDNDFHTLSFLLYRLREGVGDLLLPACERVSRSSFEVADGLFSYEHEVVPKVRFELTRDITPNGF